MLTDVKIRAVKPSNSPKKLSDSGGLHLLIQPTGGKLWRWSYRYAGKQKTLALGGYPEIGLQRARELREEGKRTLKSGIDPALQRKSQKLTGSMGTTFRAIGQEVVAKLELEGRKANTIKKLNWLLEFVYPDLGDMQVTAITAVQLLAVLRKVEVRGTHETARRLRGTCGMVFRYAIATGRAQRDISHDLRGSLTVPKVQHRAAIVEPVAVGGLLRAIDGFIGQATTKAALQLSPLVFVRPGELRHAEWTEFDLDGALWSIPGEKMKMGKPHRVPLSKQAIRIVKELQPISGRSKYLFPSILDIKRPMSDNTVSTPETKCIGTPE